MSNKELNELDTDSVEETIEEQIEEDIQDTEETSEDSKEKTIEKDPELEEEIKQLDEGTLPLFNEEKMGKLLNYILSRKPFVGSYKKTESIDLVESMIHDIKSVEEYPDNAIVSVSYTKEELEQISTELMRVIQASQFKRKELSREEIKKNYTRVDDLRLILTNEETILLSYITSSLNIMNQSPNKDSFDEGKWTNTLEYNDKRIGTALVVNYKDPIKQMRSKLNLMNEAAVQLVHSGLVVKLTSAGSLDQALLNDNLVSTKINNSIATYGTGLDMTSIYVDEILVEHIHRQIVDTNVGEISLDTFEENLSILDLNTLYNTLAISLHPTGFKMFRQCMDVECSNIDEITINPRRTNIYRDDKIQQSSKQHLIRGLSKSDIKSLVEYRNNLTPGLTKFHELSEGMYVKFQVPTFAQYKRISKYWLEYLGDKSLDLMRGGSDEDTRRRYIQQAMYKASVMMYSHWVEGIYTKDDNGEYQEVMVRLKESSGASINSIITVDEKIDTLLSDTGLNKEVHNSLVKAINKFISDSTLALTVLGKSKCTKCESDYIPEGEDVGDQLISFNAGELFFTLLRQRIEGQ